MEIFKGIEGFAWDAGNADKSKEKHNVSPIECEELFFNAPLIVGDDEKHSIPEKRFYALGRTNLDRRLFIVFTVREKKLRVISARDMNRKERKIYEDAEKDTEI